MRVVCVVCVVVVCLCCVMCEMYVSVSICAHVGDSQESFLRFFLINQIYHTISLYDTSSKEGVTAEMRARSALTPTAGLVVHRRSGRACVPGEGGGKGHAGSGCATAARKDDYHSQPPC